MIVLNENHKKQFAQDRLGLFTEEMVAYFSDNEKYYAELIGEDGLREVVKLGINRAKSHGITWQSPVRLYIHLMFHLGSYFDVDPLLTWARKTLENPDYAGAQQVRMNRVREQKILFFNDIYGENREHLKKIISRVYADVKSGNLPNRDIEINGYISSMMPNRFKEENKALILDLVADTQRHLINLGMTRISSTVILTIMRILYGIGVPNDPLFPWVRNILYTEGVHEKDDQFMHEAECYFSKIMDYSERC